MFLAFLLVAQTFNGFEIANRTGYGMQSFASPPGCGVQQFKTGSDAIVKHGVTSKWTCDRAQVNGLTHPIIVSKSWFKANCKQTSTTSATCTALAQEDPSLTLKHAAGPSMWKHRLEDVAVGTAVGVLVVGCIASGGCAAMGGGL